MKSLLSTVLVLTAASWCAAQQATIVSQDVLDRIPDNTRSPLPASLAPEERLLPQPTVTPEDLRLAAPPSGEVYTPAEYELNQGMLIVWNHYNSMLTAMTVPVTTGDSEATVYVVVTGASQQASATSTLTSAGADMSHVEFITYYTDTGWIRDYGPRFIFEDGSRAIVDHIYNRPRPHDDAFPGFLGDLWDEPVYDIPIVHGGGNWHLFANGDLFMTDLILEENPALSEQDVEDLMYEYHNLDLTIYEGFPWACDGTKHIDMWMLPVDDYKVIIGQYQGSAGYEPKQITDYAAADMTARGYTVYRTPGWNSGSGGYGGTHYTYTNATILNDFVFIPSYSGYSAKNAEAKAVFEEAFPDRQIIQVDCSSIIHSAGAMHCSMMHVPAYTTALRVSPSGGLAAEGPVGGPFAPESMAYTLENAGEEAIDYSVTATADWLTITGGSGTIPAGGSVEVTVALNETAETLGAGAYEDTVSFINLTDHDGDTTRPAHLVVGVPEVIYEFNMDSDPGWSMTGQWEFGEPLGQGGSSHGYADPSGGATGGNVCGVNLAGDYSTSIGGPYHLTSGPIDCSDLTQVSLRFQRWLNTDYQPYVYATVEVSNDGSDWEPIWSNGTSEIADNQWQEISFDLTEYADGESALYVRWGHEVGSSGAYAYSGWNIDDVEIWGIAGGGPGETVLPEDYQIVRGQHVSGGLDDLLASDDERLVVRLGFVLSSAEPPVWIEVEGTATTADPTELWLTLEAQANTIGLTQRMKLFNYDTQSFEELDSGAGTITDSVTKVKVPGDPARFIDPDTLEMKAQLTWKAEGPVTLYPWQVGLDQVAWTLQP